jgi:putative endonuclease
MNKREKGIRGEALAASFLEKEGYEILERNYRFDRGEIDLIAKEGGDLVFVEVKARHTGDFGSPEEAVSTVKEETLKKTAEGYLFERRISNQSCRFDVVAITYQGSRPAVRIIRNVFM